MAATWDSVAANPDFKALAPDQQEVARQQYFKEVVAPNVPQDKLDSVKQQFDAYSSKAADPGFGERVAADFNARGDAMNKSADTYVAGEQSLPSTYLQTAGNIAGAITDPAIEAAKSVAKPVMALGEAVTPKAISEPMAATGKAIGNYISDSAVGDVARQYGSKISDLVKDHPEAAANLKAAGDIVGVVPVGKAVEGASAAAAGAGDLLSSGGKMISAGADARTAAAKSDFVKELITPKLTPTVKADQFSRSTEQGIFRKRVVEPTAQEKAIADTVSQLPVSDSNSLLKNYNIISDANTAEAERLQNVLQKTNATFKLGELNSALDKSMDVLKQNPFLAGDGEAAANRVMDGFKAIVIKNNDLSASGLLQARKDFDTWVKAQKGAGIFDPARDSPVSIAVQNIRQTVNNLVADKVPSAGVKESLAKQSNLYRAMDNIETKGGNEAPGMISRATKKLTDIIPAKTAGVKTALALGGLGAGVGAATMAPALTAGVGGAYLAKKLITSPTTQKAAGMALDASGKVLKAARPTLQTIIRIP